MMIKVCIFVNSTGSQIGFADFTLMKKKIKLTQK